MPPEDVEDIRLAARRLQALSKLTAEVRAEIGEEIRLRVAGKLERRTERAMIARKRTQARKQGAGSNRPLR